MRADCSSLHTQIVLAENLYGSNWRRLVAAWLDGVANADHAPPWHRAASAGSAAFLSL